MAFDGENDDNGGSAAAALVGGGAGASGGDAGASGGAAEGGSADGGAAAAGGDAGAADPDWYANLSADADGEAASNRDWIKAKGFKDLDGVTKALRNAEKAIHDSGRIKIPGADAKPEEIAEFHKAIGVPEDPKGYEFKAPTDADGNEIPLDTALLGRIAESAHKHGLPKAALEGVVADFVQAQLDQAADFDSQQQAEAQKIVKGWGAEGTAKLAAIDSAARVLGLNANEMVAIRNALGAEKALGMFARLGEGLAEDKLITGEAKRFGISGPEAKQEIANLKQDKDFQAKLMSGDPVATARWNRLNEAEAAWEEAQRRAA